MTNTNCAPNTLINDLNISILHEKYIKSYVFKFVIVQILLFLK